MKSSRNATSPPPAIPTDLEAFEAASADAMRDYGRRLASWLLNSGPCAIMLTGELGAGKTTLVKGLASGLEVAAEDEVTSPTFTLIHEYHRGGRDLYHVDLYRLESPRQIATLGLEELVTPESRTGVVAIEWGEKIEAALPQPYLRLELTATGEDRRRVRAAWVHSHAARRNLHTAGE